MYRYGRSVYNRYGPAQRQWYAQPARGVSYASAGANMRFGEFLKTQVVTHEAKAFSKQKVEKLENRDTSDGSDGGDYERDTSKKAGEPGSCKPKKKKDKDKKDGVKKEKYDAAAVPGKGGIHSRGADADGDGKTGEGKKKKGSWKGDHDGDKVPDAIDKDYTSDGSVSYTSSSSDDEGKMTKSKSNASAADSDGSCGCGCSSKNSSKKENGCGGLKKTISKASASDGKKHKSGKIYRSRDGKHDYFVYYKGKKISFGDASMPNRQNNDGARANFNARHNCSEKKDKSKAGYWACKVWRRGFKA